MIYKETCEKDAVSLARHRVHKRELDNIKAYCENSLNARKTGNASYKDLTVEEVLEHIKKIVEEGLEKGITFLS